MGGEDVDPWEIPRGVDPRIFFLVVVLVVLICLILLEDLYSSMLIVSMTTSVLVTTLALIGIFNYGDLHKGKKVHKPSFSRGAVRSYVPGGGGPPPVGRFTHQRFRGGYNPKMYNPY